MTQSSAPVTASIAEPLRPSQQPLPDLRRGPISRGRVWTRLPGLLIGLADLALKRLWHHPGLALLELFGVTLAIGLVTSAGFFAQAVDAVMLRQELDELSQMTGRPAFSTRVYFFPSPRKPMPLEVAEQTGHHVADTLSSEIGLPLKHTGLQVESGSLMLMTQPNDLRWAGERRHLGSVNLVYIAGIRDHMEIVAGDPLDEVASGEALDVWMHAYFAEKMGVHVGERFEVAVTLNDIPILVQIKGIWRARNPKDPYWFNNPDMGLRESLLVRRQDYIARVQPTIPSGTRFVAWHIILDERQVLPDKARQYAAGLQRGLAVINKYLPDARLDMSPLGPLETFVQRQTTLTTTILAFNVPAFGFLLYFLVLTSAIVARWQRRETAILVSRGMGASGVLGLTLVEEVLLCLVGLPLGIGLGLGIARLMGYADSFLSFTGARPPLPVSLHGMNLVLILSALGVALASRLGPAIAAARQSVVEQEREHARPLRNPFWHRYYLDVLLVLPTVYAYQQLLDKGTLALLVRDRPEDLYRDPLLILVPALFILTAALISMRLFPLVMWLMDRLASVAPWIVPHLALRQLGRQSQSYANPLLLVITSLALGIYTLSMAASLDQWLVDRMYYRVGADVVFEPAPLRRDDGPTEPAAGADWIPLPSEFLDLPGVQAVTRVGDYPAEIQVGNGNSIRGRFLAIDRLDFPKVAWFRDDLADEPLGGLMNRLATSSENLLVSEQFLRQRHLQIGDRLTIRVKLDELTKVSSTFVIAGTYRYFPTVYEDQVAVIGNLEHLFSFFGATFPHQIWLRVAEGTDGKATLAAVPRKGVEATRPEDARVLIAEEQAKMERVGIFGTLSIGFLAAAIMAALGLLLHSYASLRERLYRFAVLRSIGLLRRQIVGQVILEYSVLTAYSAVAAIVIGAFASQLFIPFFRITGERGVPLPPLLPVIAQDRIVPLAIAFAGFMILMELAVVAMALYRRLFEAVRMGDQG
ncbi:MAG: ABC transporter permease [Anaerolineae bacterium]|nr:ABC transporter permease [Anaerolineae bacterium]MDW8098441.1 ABC transporter permease [Anaerolineae bacterium]